MKKWMKFGGRVVAGALLLDERHELVSSYRAR